MEEKVKVAFKTCQISKNEIITGKLVLRELEFEN